VNLLPKSLNKNVVLTILGFVICSASAQSILAKDNLTLNNEKWRADGYSINSSKVSEHPAYRPLNQILVGFASPEMLAKMRAAFPDITFVPATEKIKASDKYDAVLLLCGRGTLAKAPHASWVHTYSAGVDSCMGLTTMQELVARDEGVILTNSSGTAAPVIAEHTIAMMLTLSRGLHRFRDEQANANWNRGLANAGVTSVINGKTMLVLGLGSIGSEVAQRANALGMRVIATRHSSREGPDYVDYVGLTDETLKLAAQADVIVNALPLTNSTRGFIDQKFFDVLPKNALYLSVGRGGTTDTDALLKALQTNAIAGAGLDVTDPEPLPSNHPLWKETNVIITPHLSGSGGASLGKTLELALENIRRYQAGEPMLNIVNIELGY